MNGSVTTLGNIPATAKVYTQAQTDAAISGSVAAISGLVSGVTEEQWQTINDIIQDAGNVAMKSDVDSVVKAGEDVTCGNRPALLLGSGESDLQVIKFNHSSGGWVTVITEDMLYSGICGLQEAMIAGITLSSVAGGICGIQHMYCGAMRGDDLYYQLSGIGQCGVSGVVSMLTVIESGLRSGSGYSYPVTADNICDAVQSCIGTDLCGLSDRICGLESVDYSGLSSGISSLASAISGIGSGLAEIKSGISGLPAAIVQAIIDAGDDPSASEPIRRAAAKVAAAGTPEDNGIVKPVVQDLNSDVNNPAVFGEGGVEDSLEDASDALSGISESVSSGASSDAQAAASAADDAKTTVDSEKSAVEAVGNFVP